MQHMCDRHSSLRSAAGKEKMVRNSAEDFRCRALCEAAVFLASKPHEERTSAMALAKPNHHVSVCSWPEEGAAAEICMSH